MGRTFANVVRREIPSLKFVHLSLSFRFAFAAKFVGSNPKIFLQVKAESLKFFAFKAGFRSVIDHDGGKANAN